MKQAANMRQFQPDADLVAIADAPAGASAMHDPRAGEVTLYAIPPSLCSQRVRMALLEKGVVYTEHMINTANGENLTPEYIALNPRALVPTLAFGKRVIFDSATIMRFVNNWFDGPPLAPADPLAFEAMMQWMRRSDDFPIRGFTYRAHLHSGLPDYWRVGMHDNILRARDLYPQHRDIYDLKLQDWHDLVAWMDNPGDSREGEALAARMADDIEIALATHPFLLGNDLSLADISIFILMIRLQCGCEVRLWSPRLRPRLSQWVEALKQRSSYDGAVLAPYRTSGLVQVSGDCWLPQSAAA